MSVWVVYYFSSPDWPSKGGFMIDSVHASSKSANKRYDKILESYRVEWVKITRYEMEKEDEPSLKMP